MLVHVIKAAGLQVNIHAAYRRAFLPRVYVLTYKGCITIIPIA
jgi:hypothetical protein